MEFGQLTSRKLRTGKPGDQRQVRETDSNVGENSAGPAAARRRCNGFSANEPPNRVRKDKAFDGTASQHQVRTAMGTATFTQSSGALSNRKKGKANRKVSGS